MCISAAGSAYSQSISSSFNLDARYLIGQQLVINGENVCVAQNSIPGFMKSELHVDVFEKNSMSRKASARYPGCLAASNSTSALSWLKLSAVSPNKPTNANVAGSEYSSSNDKIE